MTVNVFRVHPSLLLLFVLFELCSPFQDLESSSCILTNKEVRFPDSHIVVTYSRYSIPMAEEDVVRYDYANRQNPRHAVKSFERRYVMKKYPTDDDKYLKTRGSSKASKPASLTNVPHSSHPSTKVVASVYPHSPLMGKARGRISAGHIANWLTSGDIMKYEELNDTHTLPLDLMLYAQQMVAGKTDKERRRYRYNITRPQRLNYVVKKGQFVPQRNRTTKKRHQVSKKPMNITARHRAKHTNKHLSHHHLDASRKPNDTGRHPHHQETNKTTKNIQILTKRSKVQAVEAQWKQWTPPVMQKSKVASLGKSKTIQNDRKKNQHKKQRTRRALAKIGHVLSLNQGETKQDKLKNLVRSEASSYFWNILPVKHEYDYREHIAEYLLKNSTLSHHKQKNEKQSSEIHRKLKTISDAIRANLELKKRQNSSISKAKNGKTDIDLRTKMLDNVLRTNLKLLRQYEAQLQLDEEKLNKSLPKKLNNGSKKSNGTLICLQISMLPETFLHSSLGWDVKLQEYKVVLNSPKRSKLHPCITKKGNFPTSHEKGGNSEQTKKRGKSSSPNRKLNSKRNKRVSGRNMRHRRGIERGVQTKQLNLHFLHNKEKTGYSRKLSSKAVSYLPPMKKKVAKTFHKTQRKKTKKIQRKKVKTKNNTRFQENGDKMSKNDRELSVCVHVVS